MKLQLVDRRGTPNTEAEAPGAWDRSSERWHRLNRAVDQLGPDTWWVNLVLVDDAAMVDLNRRFREIDGVTDVLSFSYLLEQGDGPADLTAGARGACRDLWLDGPADPDADPGDAPVGEIVLAPGFVADSCLNQDWDLETELTLLTVHGILHLLGWRHDAAAEQEAMREAETEALARVDLEHPAAEEELSRR